MVQTRSSSKLRTLGGVLTACVLMCGAAGVASAQQRPLATQDPESIGAGQVLVEGGFDYGTDILFPVSGLKGNLLRVPTLGVVVGVSSIAEIQITGGPYKRLSISSRRPAPLADLVTAAGETTTSVEDLVVGAKVRLIAETETRPAVAFRFATRLPNASEESGIGLDTTEFHAALLVAKSVQSIRVAANAGLGILPDPVSARRQNDVLTYGISFARALNTEVDLVGELNGRLNTRDDAPVGTESLGAFRVGGRYTRGAGRFDAGLVIGLTARDPGFGFTAGFTYVFKAFTPGG